MGPYVLLLRSLSFYLVIYYDKIHAIVHFTLCCDIVFEGHKFAKPDAENPVRRDCAAADEILHYVGGAREG